MSKGPKEDGYSPWGKIQHVKEIALGIWVVSTAGHGGIKLDRSRNSRMPEYVRRAGGWYEEDSEWSLPYVVFALGNAKQQTCAIETMKNWYPDEYEKLTGTVLKEGESKEKDARLWRAKHRHDYQVYSAVGDWHEDCPEGFALVHAARGGRIIDSSGVDRPGPDRKMFLIPIEEYQARGDHGFAVDTARHEEFIKDEKENQQLDHDRHNLLSGVLANR